MNITEINSLLKKFYEGETALEEEKLLQEYFARNNENIENHKAEKYLFANLNLAENIEVPVDLTEKISAKIDAEIKNIRKYRPAIKLRMTGIAASIALLISITAAVINSNSEQPKFIANVNINETEMMEMLEHSFSKISNVVDDAIVLLDVTGEQVCEINEVLNSL
ncbi:MAG: hypothetical protein LBK94_07720 [Prevotellaceae bacterium]|jgi:hypothetical protein|nr:hypothetical protein [Prevotellaceae bacterium]